MSHRRHVHDDGRQQFKPGRLRGQHGLCFLPTPQHRLQLVLRHDRSGVHHQVRRQQTCQGWRVALGPNGVLQTGLKQIPIIGGHPVALSHFQQLRKDLKHVGFELRHVPLQHLRERTKQRRFKIVHGLHAGVS